MNRIELANSLIEQGTKILLQESIDLKERIKKIGNEINNDKEKSKYYKEMRQKHEKEGTMDKIPEEAVHQEILDKYRSKVLNRLKERNKDNNKSQNETISELLQESIELLNEGLFGFSNKNKSNNKSNNEPLDSYLLDDIKSTKERLKNAPKDPSSAARASEHMKDLERRANMLAKQGDKRMLNALR